VTQEVNLAQQRAKQFSEASDDIDLADIGRSLQRRWRTILVFTGCLTFVITLWMMLSPPNFSPTGLLYFTDAQLLTTPQASNGSSLLTTYQSNTNVPTAVQVLEAPALIERAILETGLNVVVEPHNQTPPALWKFKFLEGSQIDVFAPKPRKLIIRFATFRDPGNTGGLYALRFGPGGSYKVIRASGSGKVVASGMIGQPASGPGLTLQVDSAAPGPPPPAGAVYDLTITPAEVEANNLIGNALLVITQIGAPTAPTNTISVQLFWYDPFQAAQFVNQLMDDFLATQISWTNQAASASDAFLSGELGKVQNELSDADDKLADYQAKTGILDVPANAQAGISQLSTYEEQRTAALVQEQAFAQLLATIKTSHGALNPYLVTASNDPVLAQLASALATAEVTQQSESLQYTGEAPELQQQEATISRIKTSIKSLLQNDEALAATNVADLDKQIADFKNFLRTEPAQSLEITALTQSSQVLGQIYVLLMQNEEEAEVSKAATIVDTRVASSAQVPLFASRPLYKIFIAAAVLLGLMGGVALVLTQRVLSGRFHSENDVRRQINLPVLGLIPLRPKRERGYGVFPAAAGDPFAQSFRLLRSKLYQQAGPQAATAQVLLAASALTGDGRTTLAVNLAKTLSDDGKRVLLLDGDLHRGQLHFLLGLPQSPGLAEWLLGQETPPARQVNGQNFVVMPAGRYPANPSEVLNLPTLATVFSALRGQFDYIIVDCPPLPRVTDTLALVAQADFVLSVLFIEKTQRTALAAHLSAFGAMTIGHGIVINGLFNKVKRKTAVYGAPVPPPWHRRLRQRFWAPPIRPK
jgi:uncharacterized protein involved in exopolysaccharide biosynthesis/Mrp family chromosome partitioning ATPase